MTGAPAEAGGPARAGAHAASGTVREVGADIEPIESWRAAGAHLEVDLGGARRRIFWLARGPASAPPLLVLHGFPTASHDFAPVVRRLEGERRVVLFDMLGYGFSDKPAGHRYSLLEQASIAEAVAGAAGLARFHLVAHDMGASVAQEMLARPAVAARIDGVTLLNGGLLLAVYRPRLIQRLLRTPLLGDLVARLVTRRAFDRNLRAIFSPLRPPSAALLDALWALVERDRGTRNYGRLIRYIDERHVHEPRWLAALRAYPGPVTLLWGMRDPISSAVGPALALLRPGTALRRFEDLGHYPQLEDDAAIAAALLDATAPGAPCAPDSSGSSASHVEALHSGPPP